MAVTLTVGSISVAMSYASGTINIPNKEYWLSALVHKSAKFGIV